MLNRFTAKAGCVILPASSLGGHGPAVRSRNGSARFSWLVWLVLLPVFLAAFSSFGGGTVSHPTETALRAALIGGGQVTIACDGIILLSSTITNTADVSFDGSGHNVTISGGSSNRVFEVQTNVHLELRTLTVANGSARCGAGILNGGGRVTLRTVVFERNVAGRELQYTNTELAEGGAILNRGGVIAATNCTFFSNVVAQATDPYVRWVQSRGGAICNSAGIVLLDSCTFHQNTALGPPRNFRSRDGCGGAIHNAGTLTVLNSDFTENLAGGGAGAGSSYGGAICNYGMLEMSGSFFVRNTAFGTQGPDGSYGMPVGGDTGGPGGSGGSGGGANGGAVFNGGKALFAETMFVQNTAIGGAGGAGGPGADMVFLPPGHIGFGGNGGNGGNGGAGFGAICDITACCTLSNCVLDSNSGIPGQAGAGGRGGYSTRNGSDGIAGKTGDAAGAIRSLGAVLFDSVLRSNTPTACEGTITDAGGNSSSDQSCAAWRFGYEPARETADYRCLYNFGIPDLAVNGQPFGFVLVGQDGMLYGSTYGAQFASYPLHGGSVFAVSADASMSSFRSLVEPSLRPYSVSAIVNQQLFGTSRLGGTTDQGILFGVNTDGTGFGFLRQFGEDSGSYPIGGLVASNDTLYGVTDHSATDNGTIFSVRTDGSNFVTLKRFQSTAEGTQPTAPLLLSENMLYGTSYSGGAGGEGVVFRMSTDGTGYTVLKHFYLTDDGRHPTLWVVSGAVLYGSTYYTQDYDGWRGTIFRINTDGTGFQTLHRFPEKAEAEQYTGGLVLVNNRLIGTTAGGGIYSCGRLFKICTDGTGYEVLRQFSGLDGAKPGSLTLAGQSVFGTTRTGGFFGEGVVFQMSVSLPEVVVTPASQTSEAGSAAAFSGSIHGPAVASLQWYFNGTNIIPGAKGPVLGFGQTDITNTGTYSLVAVNPFGATTNSAILNVVAAVPRVMVPGIEIDAEPGNPVVIESVQGLRGPVEWKTLGSLETVNGPAWFVDSPDRLERQTFYRAYQSSASWPPQLSMLKVPAITLIGSPGRTVRIDWIDAIGPTNNWHSLATVTLTNSAQSVFDTGAALSPARSYRVVELP